MIFRNILINILHKLQNERSASSPYYILRGKRSGQSIQDVGIYQLHHYFSILPKLSKKFYDEQINQLLKKGILITKSDGTFSLKVDQLNNENIPFFDGWYYRGNEHIFFARLSLIIQTLSHKKNEVMNFFPIQKDEQIQKWVRHFLISHHYHEGNINEQLYKEIDESLKKLTCEDDMKNIVINRFTGLNMPGVTWSQLASINNLNELDIQLLYISCLHQWLNEIYNNPSLYPLLMKISEGVRYVQPLTGSAAQTAMLFKQGYSIEQISSMRNIKESTVEDHLVELAMNDRQFNIHQFISEQDVKQVLSVSKEKNTKKLKVIHEFVPHLTFFQLRLALARGENI